MLTKETINYIIENGKIKRTFQDYLNYFFLIGPLAIVCIGLAMLYGYFSYRDHGNLLIPAIGLLLFGLFAIYYVLKRLNGNISFISIPFNNSVDMDNFCEKLKNLFKKAKIYPDENLRTIVVMTGTTAFSWGEQLTIIFEKDRILINSRPNGFNQPITILKDSLNIKRIRRLLEGV